jgi:uncharacterized protein
VSFLKALHYIAFALLVIGGINWGLVGLFNFDLVAKIFGDMSTVSKVVYTLVGLSAIFESITHGIRCKVCKPETQTTTGAV